MSQALESELLAAAWAARERSYSPYSHYAVGAAVLTHSGRIFGGCNIENASYGATVCAERVALWKALSEGECELVTMAVVTVNGGSPCGICRQVMAEFAPEMAVLIADAEGNIRRTAVQELLPGRFRPDDIVSEVS